MFFNYFFFINTIFKYKIKSYILEFLYKSKKLQATEMDYWRKIARIARFEGISNEEMEKKGKWLYSNKKNGR